MYIWSYSSQVCYDITIRTCDIERGRQREREREREKGRNADTQRWEQREGEHKTKMKSPGKKYIIWNKMVGRILYELDHNNLRNRSPHESPSIYHEWGAERAR